MAAEAQQELTHAGERVVQARAARAAHRAAPVTVLEADHHDRALEAVREPPRHDPDDALSPTLATEHERGSIRPAALADLGFGFGDDAVLRGAPQHRLLLDGAGQLSGALRVLLEQELERDRRRAEPARSV